MAKEKPNSIQEPSLEELEIYKQFISDISEEQLDIYANEYFELVSEEKTNVSFAKYLIDKIIRPIKPGDTITINTEDEGAINLFCLVRKEIDGKDYLAFAKVENETETLHHEDIYLFFVDGKDNIGTEYIDILPAGEDADRILKIMEEDIHVTTPEEKVVENKEQE